MSENEKHYPRHDCAYILRQPTSKKRQKKFNCASTSIDETQQYFIHRWESKNGEYFEILTPIDGKLRGFLEQDILA